jgi:hypothetical protein
MQHICLLLHLQIQMKETMTFFNVVFLRTNCETN